MIKKILAFLFKHEIKIGIIGFVISLFILILEMRGKISTFIEMLPLVINWLCVFLIGDYLNRKTGEGSIFPHRKNQKDKLIRLMLASFISFLIVEVSCTWFARLWYYPNFNYWNYLLMYLPIGLIINGFIMYAFYRLFKRNLDDKVKGGRPSDIKQKIYKFIIMLNGFLGIIGVIVSFSYFQNLNLFRFDQV